MQQIIRCQILQFIRTCPLACNVFLNDRIKNLPSNIRTLSSACSKVVCIFCALNDPTIEHLSIPAARDTLKKSVVETSCQMCTDLITVSVKQKESDFQTLYSCAEKSYPLNTRFGYNRGCCTSLDSLIARG